MSQMRRPQQLVDNGPSLCLPQMFLKLSLQTLQLFAQQVTEMSLNVALVELSMVLLYNACDPEKVCEHPVLPNFVASYLCPCSIFCGVQMIPKALKNTTFSNFCISHGLALISAELAFVRLSFGKAFNYGSV